MKFYQKIFALFLSASIFLSACGGGGGTTPLSAEKAITAFSFTSPAAIGTIDENAKTIALTVPYGTDVTALVATFTTTGASVNVGAVVQESDTTPNDFTNRVAYVVTAADGSTATYMVTVTIGPSSAKAILTFSIINPAVTATIDEQATTIAFTVPYGTDLTALVATFTTTGASVNVGTTVQVSGTTPNNFTSPVTYTVTAADGTTASYTVFVTVATNSAKAITAFSFTSPAATGAIDENAKTIALTVPYGTDVTALVATFTTTGTNVNVYGTDQVSGTTPNDFSNPVVYTVTAMDNSTTTYTVTVTVTPNPAKAISAFSFMRPAATGTIDENAKTIALTVPYGTDMTALVATFTTTGASVNVGATVQVSGTTPNNFTSPVLYVVTAADSTTVTYTVTVKTLTAATALVTNGPVYAVVVGADGTTYIGGSFSQLRPATGSGVPIARNNIAAIDSTGAATAWAPNANNTVYALAVSGSTVYAGGQFTSIGIGVKPRNYIAAIDSTGDATDWNPIADDTVYALAVSGSTVYTGGIFTNIGVKPRNYIAAIDSSTGVATDWNPIADDTVYALAVSGSTVYAGGSFTIIGGQTRYSIAAIDSTGVAITEWNPYADDDVYALAISGSTVYAGGKFTVLGGEANYIGAIDSTGATIDWNPNANGFVYALAVSGSTVYAGGSFTIIGGQVANSIAAIDSTGHATVWNPNADNDVRALAVSGSTVYAGGDFSSIEGDPFSYFAILSK